MERNLEFIEEGHLYLKDGVLLPSVSEILHFIFPNKYRGVDQQVLNAKSEYGSKVHESIENYEKVRCKKGLEEAYRNTVNSLNLDDNQIFSLKQYIRLKDRYGINVISQEQMIHYKDEYAGRFDMIAKKRGHLSLCDIKTTSLLDKEYLSWQLSFYELAYMTMFKTPKFEGLYAIWLPKRGYGELVEIERKPISELLRVLKEFKESRKEVEE